MPALTELPVVVVGAGPVGLAAAAHLLENGLTPLVLEAGSGPGMAVQAWGHTRLFSPWRYNLDAAAVRLLEPTGWVPPRLTALPTGTELVTGYLEPLAATAQLAPLIRTGTTVVAVTRQGMDKTHSKRRDETPFLVRTRNTDGTLTDILARAVIDASGTWNTPNPLGQAGLTAVGEREAGTRITAPLPDVLGVDRGTFAGRHVLVVGAGHSAANILLALGELARAEQGTRISWAVRGPAVTRLYGGGDLDGLPARGMLGTRLRKLVETGIVDLHTAFSITGLVADSSGLAVQGSTPAGERVLSVDVLIPATGFRPDLDIVREIRLELDPGLEAPRQLAPLIDPEFHSCGTVPAHGAKLLAHPEKDFYIVGMRSYGRAPTFLLATGYEQVRSIAAALAGNQEAADRVQLELPETGVCSTDTGPSCGAPAAGTEEESACCAAPEPVLVGFPTGLLHGRYGDTEAAGD
ncbi:NAD(P)-binding domain-containing protein [Paenarthrobacter sp. Z7-10]|uniref:FAD-dependent oxidoreductase n=1 Tax=Paenarthrobacter sp. Z7-10 TaxID=2787635 RepID=UPI0022A94300|nr:FAD-dependent oxidoreductase [Paenarthrobacter sp. Z7-10]MCZ2403828.1 NAD(P)-binding domain-containing protein [Paenarthrobacter sp. Z7-10]